MNHAVCKSERQWVGWALRAWRCTVPLLSLVFALGWATAALAEPKVEEIVTKANLAAFYAGRDGRATVSMVIDDGKGHEQERRFSMLRLDVGDAGEQRYLVVFERPAELRKTVMLVHKHVKGDDDRWLFMPALDLVKRIAAGDKRTSFVGSHVLYEDVSGRNPIEDHHTLVSTTQKSYVVRGVPKDPSNVEFHHYDAHIDRSTFLPRQVQYFDAKGKVMRTLEAKAMQVLDGHPTVTRMEVTDAVRGGKTSVSFAGIDYDLGIPESVFTERSLRSPPHPGSFGKP